MRSKSAASSGLGTPLSQAHAGSSWSLRAGAWGSKTAQPVGDGLLAGIEEHGEIGLPKSKEDL